MKKARSEKQQKKSLLKGTDFRKEAGSPFEIVMETIQQLPNERMQDVLSKRFGLNDTDLETLETIGKKLSVTRERVRQIENEALKKIAGNKYPKSLENLVRRIRDLLSEYEGIASEFRILNEFDNRKLKEIDNRALVLVLKMDKNFCFFNKPQEYERTWHLKGAGIEIIQKLKDWLVEELEKKKRPIPRQEIIKILNDNPEFKKLANNVLYSYIDIPKAVQQDIFGEWGICNWPEIKPRGVRDKVHLVFEKIGQPIHFSQIAKEANKLKIDKKIARTPTIHNELIKDPRFILIGRGIYALKEWKYQSGTVAEILTKILEKSNKSLAKDVLVKEVLKQRQVKPATVVLNLHRPDLFIREEGDLYSLKR